MLRIGIDGGGTTTRAVVVDDNLEVLARGEAGSSNHYSLGVERAVGNIVSAVEGALESGGIAVDDITGWGAGLAGACTNVEQETLLRELRRFASNKLLVIDEDAAAAQAGAFGGNPGVVCIAGTGANCYGRNADGKRARADGLGPLLGDRGSGYRIGEAALRAACSAYDGSTSQTLLLQACLTQLNVASVDELVQLVYRPDFSKDRVAAIFPRVLECAAQGDEIANRILQNAGEELAASALSVLNQLQVRAVAPTGGVISRDTPVRHSFENSLRVALPDVQIQEPMYDAAIGAALLIR
jgi:N-acetylglucosamine kinase